jgi:hypothetical protein
MHVRPAASARSNGPNRDRPIEPDRGELHLDASVKTMHPYRASEEW